MPDPRTIAPPPKGGSLRKKLELKLQEYRDRMSERHGPKPGGQPEAAQKMRKAWMDAYYKATVLDAVLKSEGPFNADSLCAGMAKRFKGDFDADQFNAACDIIAYYCGGLKGAVVLQRGTGLPGLPDDETKELHAVGA